MGEVEVGPPRSFPLKSLEQLRYRSYFDSAYFTFNRSSVPLQRSTSSREKRPRLLACHDMQGGYLDDQWIQGTSNADTYTLTHWRLLDSFVYFSHNLVTLPPPCWTNAAHRHGVQVLGTFITEWSEGEDLCKELFSSKESAHMYADRLSELAQALGFDGWLINIENVIVKEQVPNLQEFLRHLTASMHSLVPQSLVIWYDSVTIEGALSWQDRLNDANKPFFDFCDGIFTNYTWKEDYPKQSAAAAGDRAYDVYMGVDVFGRKTFGGGGYQCDVALQVARDAGVSAALFGPGWAYETKQDEGRWWGRIERCWPAARQDPVQLPFFTDFDIGHGRTKYIDGKQVSDLPWSNLSCQNLQPLLCHTESTQQQLIVFTSQDYTIFSGGVCMKVVGDVGADEVCFLQLYHTDAVIEEIALAVSYSVLAQSNSNFCLVLRLQDHKGAEVLHFLMNPSEGHVHSLPSNHQFTHISAVFQYAGRDAATEAVSYGNEPVLDKVKVKSFCGGTLWNVRDFNVQWGHCKLIGIYGVCSAANDLQPLLIKLLHENETLFGEETFVKWDISTKHCYPRQVDTIQTSEHLDGDSTREENGRSYSVRIGHISVVPVSHRHSFTVADVELMGHHPSWLVGPGGDRFLSMNLCWDLRTDDGKSGTWASEKYHLYAGTGELEDNHPDPTLKYLGVALVEAFYVYMLPVPNLAPTITFHLHRQCACGKVQTISNRNTYTLRVPSRDSRSYVRTQPSLSDWLFRELE